VEKEIKPIFTPFSAEQLLELPNAVISLAPDRLRHELVDPDDQHILVVGPV
jgi:hypothetical protein